MRSDVVCFLRSGLVVVVLLLAASAPASAAPVDIAARTGELDEPSASTMVLLYYDLAGLPVPIDKLVEEDKRVAYGKPADKAARRVEVRAELESAAASVRDVGVLRLSLDRAELSDYDPAYGEFIVGALAPSSGFSFTGLGQTVSLKFGNGKTAQIWKVPEAESRAVRDKVSSGSAGIDLVAKITKVQPAPGGGTIIADVVEYELRTWDKKTIIGRVKVAAK